MSLKIWCVGPLFQCHSLNTCMVKWSAFIFGHVIFPFSLKNNNHPFSSLELCKKIILFETTFQTQFASECEFVVHNKTVSRNNAKALNNKYVTEFLAAKWQKFVIGLMHRFQQLRSEFKQFESTTNWN